MAKRTSKRKSDPRDEWTARNQSDVAEFFGVALNTVIGWKKMGMPGTRGRWPLDEIAQWLRTDGPWRPWGKGESDDDLLTSGGSSPALERYRAARAAQAELDYARDVGQVISRETVAELLRSWSDILRRAGERLVSRHGNEAKRVLDDAIAGCERVAESSVASGRGEAVRTEQPSTKSKKSNRVGRG